MMKPTTHRPTPINSELTDFKKYPLHPNEEAQAQITAPIKALASTPINALPVIDTESAVICIPPDGFEVRLSIKQLRYLSKVVDDALYSLVCEAHNKGSRKGKVRARLSSLTEEQVREIHADRRSLSVIAVQYAVSPMTISNIKLGKTWKHLGLPPCPSRKMASVEKILASVEGRAA